MDYILDKKSWAQANGTMGSLKGRDIYVAVDYAYATRPISLVFTFVDDEGKFNIYGDKVGFEDNNAHDIYHSNFYKLAKEIKSIMQAGGNIVALGIDKFMTEQITDDLVRCGISRVWLETVRRELRYGFLSSTVGVNMLERELVSNRVNYCSKSVVDSFSRCSIIHDNNMNRNLVKTARESDISLAVAAAQCFGMIEKDAVAELDKNYLSKALQRVAETGMTICGLESEKDGRLLLINHSAFEDVNFFTDSNGYINIVMKPRKTVTNIGVMWSNNEGVMKEKGA